MKWNHFEAFVSRNLSLAKSVEELIGPMNLRNGGRMGDFPTFRHWVEKQVDYLVVRPWTSLNLKSRDQRNTQYMIYYHIQGEDSAAARGRSLRDQAGRGVLSIEQALDDIVKWHGEYWGRQPHRPLVFDAIARKRVRPGERQYQHEGLEFYLFPRGFKP